MSMQDPEDGKHIFTHSKRGGTATLRCKEGESLEECITRHREEGWDVPGGVKLGNDGQSPVLEV